MFATATRLLPLQQQQQQQSSTTKTVTVNNSAVSSNSNNSTAYIALFHDGKYTNNIILIKYALEQIFYHCIDNTTTSTSTSSSSGGQWSMIVTILPDLEAIAEEQQISTSTSTTAKDVEVKLICSQLAAAIASKVFFYLEEPISALRLALLSGPYCPKQLYVGGSSATTTTTPVASTSMPYSSSNINDTDDPYVTTLVRAALDTYIQAKQSEWEKQKDTTTVVETSTSSTSLLTVQQLQPLIDQVIVSSCTTSTTTEKKQQQQFTYVIGLCYDAYDVQQIQVILQQYIIPHYFSYPTTTTTTMNDITFLQSIIQYIIHCATTNMVHTTTTTTSTSSTANNTDRSFSRMVLSMLVHEIHSIMVSSSSSSSSSSTVTKMIPLDHQMIIIYDIIRIYQYLNEPLSIGKMIYELIQQSSSSSSSAVMNDSMNITTKLHLTVLQIVFNIVDDMCGNQSFCQTIANQLIQYRATVTSTTNPAIETDSASTVPIVDVSTTTSMNDGANDIIWDHILRVLTGGFVSELTLSFRHKHNGADHKMMETVKKLLEDRSSGTNRNSVLHTTTIVTHAYLYAGTTYDAFLRNHLDWMKKASHWAKFTATASLGVIHADHVTEAMQLLEPYFPADPDDGTSSVSTTGGYAEGGSLYALGLIHGSSGTTNIEKRTEASTFLRKHLRASHANEAISHGASLAVGLACFGSADLVVVHELKDVLVTDFAVAGEAAGMAIGMVLVGTGAGNIHNALPDSSRDELMDVVSELKNYARETQHEKIIRGIAMGLAIMNFGQEENADATIEEMRTDRDPVMRYGSQYAIALAYCGTGSNKAIRILLHTAVSDVSDDVRMAAVIGLAFVLFKTPDRVPQLVKLLLESFNPHVRYASCMAVGIAMAGSGDSDSIALLEPMLDDMTDYVRQGALIGTAMIYMQQSDTCNARKIRSFRDKLTTLITEKHQSTLTKMGAILSIGIIDAGGRNCALQLGSRNGFTKMTSAVGLALWLQHWHWFPMMHMFSLALTPTLTIGLNKNLKYPKTFEIICNSKPSQFAFPKKLQEKKEKVKKHVETFTLSTTAKEKARLARKKAKEEKDTMDEGDEAKRAEDETDEKSGDAMDVDKEGEEDADEEEKPKKKRDPEPLSYTIPNPARVTKAQSQYCTFDETQRYRPIRLDESPYGVIMLNDCTPDEEEYIGTVKSPSLEPLGELAPPEPFEWIAPPIPVSTDDDNEDDKDMKETTD